MQTGANGNIGKSLGKNSLATFAINIQTVTPSDAPHGSSTWDFYSPLSRLLTIATVNNKAQFAGEEPKPGDERKCASDPPTIPCVCQRVRCVPAHVCVPTHVRNTGLSARKPTYPDAHTHRSPS